MAEGIEFVGQLPRVVFGAGQLHPRFGECVGGAVAHLAELLNPPAQLLAGEFEFSPLGLLRQHRLRAGLLRGGLTGFFRGAAEDDQHDEERPHRAEQHGEKRKQGDRGARLAASATHAAFPVRRMASASPRR